MHEFFLEIHKQPRSQMPAHAAQALFLLAWMILMRDDIEMAANPFPYVTHLDILHDALQVIDINALTAACKDKWYNQTLCKVNESVVRLGIVQGEYHWHKHENDDEFFFVVSGRFIIDLHQEGGEHVDLQPGQGFVVPKGVMHRPRAPQRTVILMVENAGIIPTGDS
jgi:mannose-6-phosphate isomerase-like protein (cupin superfamily)